MAGAVINLFLLLWSPLIIKKIGAYSMIVLATLAEALAIFLLFRAAGPASIILGFILHQSVVMLILFLLDMFLEAATTKESTTGSIRGIYLTLSGLALVLAPALVALLSKGGDYRPVFVLSGIILLPFLFLTLKTLRKIKGVSVVRPEILNTLKAVLKSKDVRNVLLAQGILQFFYAWMVIYLPLYLHTVIGFPWSKLGILFSIMLLPFVLFEIPAGRIADRFLGEKEMMIGGFVVMSGAAIWFSYLVEPVFLTWAIILFLSRVGASVVEITTESYFFKHVKATDAGIVGFFRSTRPVSYIAAPIVASVLFWFMPFRFFFVGLGVLTLSGIIFAWKIKDTR